MLQIQTHRADCGCFPAGLLLRVRLHGQLVGQRRDLAVVAAPGHAQQHGPEPGGHVKASRRGSPEPGPGPGPGCFFAWTEVSFFFCVSTPSSAGSFQEQPVGLHWICFGDVFISQSFRFMRICGLLPMPMQAEPGLRRTRGIYRGAPTFNEPRWTGPPLLRPLCVWRRMCMICKDASESTESCILN